MESGTPARALHVFQAPGKRTAVRRRVSYLRTRISRSDQFSVFLHKEIDDRTYSYRRDRGERDISQHLSPTTTTERAQTHR